MSLRWRFVRFKETLRCRLGIHRLRGYRGCGDGVHVMPIDPRGRPGPGEWRKCEWCGASWEAAYDGIEPFWKSHVPPFYRPPPIPTASPGASEGAAE